MARVLVVDDAPETVRLLASRLRPQGYQVLSAYGGQEALEVAAAQRPDAILLDVMMPGMDGIEVCRRLKADAALRTIPVILVTGKNLDEDVVQGLDAGADDYVAKPINNEILAARLRSAVRAKESHDTIARMQRELAQAQKLEAIGQLAAGIAHEINTPTQYIGDNARFLQEAFADLERLLGRFDGLLQAAQEGAVTRELVDQLDTAVREADLDYLTAEIPRAIQQSLEGVERVASIVRAMKDFSHPGGDQKQAIDLNRAIESTLVVSRNAWKYVADVVTDFAPDLPLVSCLPGDLNQVILNVVVNAAQAIEDAAAGGRGDRGTITVRTRRDGDWIEIRVADTGTGIPEEIRPRVFDHFFTTKEVGKGTGQGLTIAYSIVVEKHGGTITFESEVDKGTTFVIRLPITDPPKRRQATGEIGHGVHGTARR